jgi:mono/diheme cytochrome c family protein
MVIKPETVGQLRSRTAPYAAEALGLNVKVPVPICVAGCGPWIGSGGASFVFGTLMAAVAICQVTAEPPAVDVSKLPPPASRSIQFNEDIRPIFEANCFKCHGPEKQKSGFRLDDRAAALAGGEHGVAIFAGQSPSSPLIQFVAGLVEDMQMPPPKNGGRSLTQEEIALLRAWIDQGAAWPDGSTPDPNRRRMDHWSFQPAVRPQLPQADPTGWARNELDLFILARLDQKKLKPSPEAMGAP